jgi:hypothetical protein
VTTATLTRHRTGVDLPLAIDQLTELSIEAIVKEVGDARRARRWLTRVMAGAPDALVAHIELAQLLEQALPGSALPGVMAIESAIAVGDWQAAYDLALTNAEPSAHALAGLLLVVDALDGAGQVDPVLNLLNRALDHRFVTRPDRQLRLEGLKSL